MHVPKTAKTAFVACTKPSAAQNYIFTNTFGPTYILSNNHILYCRLALRAEKFRTFPFERADRNYLQHPLLVQATLPFQ